MWIEHPLGQRCADVFAVVAPWSLRCAHAGTDESEEGMADEPSTPQLRGEALWRAERNAIEQRNADARKRAREHTTSQAKAVSARENAMDRLEADALKALNDRQEQRYRES
jgi:hypothetical protein